jgi:RNA:NAD 2'-phosphotransferase (TPT1/KptA family)
MHTAMAAAGYPFFHVAQGMWLTDVVPADYLETAA